MKDGCSFNFFDAWLVQSRKADTSAHKGFKPALAPSVLYRRTPTLRSKCFLPFTFHGPPYYNIKSMDSTTLNGCIPGQSTQSLVSKVTMDTSREETSGDLVRPSHIRGRGRGNQRSGGGRGRGGRDRVHRNRGGGDINTHGKRPEMGRSEWRYCAFSSFLHPQLTNKAKSRAIGGRAMMLHRQSVENLTMREPRSRYT